MIPVRPNRSSLKLGTPRTVRCQRIVLSVSAVTGETAAGAIQKVDADGDWTEQCPCGASGKRGLRRSAPSGLAHVRRFIDCVTRVWRGLCSFELWPEFADRLVQACFT